MTRTVEPDPSARRPRRWGLILGGVALGLAALVTLVLWLVSAAIDADLRTLLAETDAADPGWRFLELEQRRALADEENGALVALRAKSLIPRAFASSPEFFVLFDELPAEARLNEPQIAALRTELGAVAPALAEARKLADYKTGRYPLTLRPLVFNTLPASQEVRGVAYLLSLDLKLLAQERDDVEAGRSWKALVGVGRVVGDEPFEISQLMRMAMTMVAVNALERLLAQTEPTAEDLVERQALLAAEADLPLWLIGLRGERACFDMMFEDIEAGKVKGADVVKAITKESRPLDVVALSVTAGVKSLRAALLREMNEQIDIARLPPHEWSSALRKDAMRKPRPRPTLILNLGPTGSVAAVEHRRLAKVRSAVVALAAERFRLTHERWPESADELVKADLLSGVPLDPYDGMPLRMTRLDDGLLVYAVGPNEKDDGGVIDPRDAKVATGDIGFRLWNTSARRQPPLPPPPPDDPPGDAKP